MAICPTPGRARCALHHGTNDTNPMGATLLARRSATPPDNTGPVMVPCPSEFGTYSLPALKLEVATRRAHNARSGWGIRVPTQRHLCERVGVRYRPPQLPQFAPQAFSRAERRNPSNSSSAMPAVASCPQAVGVLSADTSLPILALGTPGRSMPVGRRWSRAIVHPVRPLLASS